MGFLDWLKGFGGPEGTARTLLVVYKANEEAGYPKAECLFKMFSTRVGWMGLPAPFLQELAERLGSDEAIVHFVILSEKYGILAQHIRPLGHEGRPPSVLATTLTGLGNHLGGRNEFSQAEISFGLALRLDPEWFPAMGSLGMVQYMTGRPAVAVASFERCFAASEAFRAKARSGRRLPDLPHIESALSDAETGEAAYRKVYQECLRDLGRGRS